MPNTNNCNLILIPFIVKASNIYELEVTRSRVIIDQTIFNSSKQCSQPFGRVTGCNEVVNRYVSVGAILLTTTNVSLPETYEILKRHLYCNPPSEISSIYTTLASNLKALRYLSPPPPIQYHDEELVLSDCLETTSVEHPEYNLTDLSMERYVIRTYSDIFYIYFPAKKVHGYITRTPIPYHYTLFPVENRYIYDPLVIEVGPPDTPEEEFPYTLPDSRTFRSYHMPPGVPAREHIRHLLRSAVLAWDIENPTIPFLHTPVFYKDLSNIGEILWPDRFIKFQEPVVGTPGKKESLTKFQLDLMRRHIRRKKTDTEKLEKYLFEGTSFKYD